MESLLEWCNNGNSLIAACVAASRSIPTHTVLGEPYRKPAFHLRSHLQSIISQLLPGEDISTISSLERFNDRLVRKLDAQFAELEGKPAPAEIDFVSPLPPTNNINVIRPQFTFKDHIDNSPSTLWIPKIKEKPNAIKPLQLVEEFDEIGNPIGYTHPYKSELAALKPQDKWLDPNLFQIYTPKPLKSTKRTFIDSPEEFDCLIKHLDTVEEIAVDLEHHSYRTYQGISCLVQLSTETGGDFIVDAIALRDRLYLLNQSFTNPQILKVFHGADQDVIWLQRDFGVYVVGLFDTHRGAIELNLPQKSLRDLLIKYCNVEVDKRFQLADWRKRPLTVDKLEYARNDTHFLLPLWRYQRQELLALGGDALKNTFETSRLVCLRTYIKPILKEDSHNNLYIKSRRSFNSQQITALKDLFKWRDTIAREEDESTGYVLPNHMLLEIATTLPREPSGILACCKPIPPLLKHHLNAVHNIILFARNIPIAPIEESDITEINVKPCDFTLTQFDRQLFENSFENITLSSRKPENLINELPSITKLTSTKKNLCSRKENFSKISSSFLSPFSRYCLVKKYNETVRRKVPPVNIPTPKNTTAPTILENRKTKLHSTNDETNEQPAKKLKLDPGEPPFVHKFCKLNTAKIIDNNFTPFNYKSFDYKVFNTAPKKKKNKKKKSK